MLVVGLIVLGVTAVALTIFLSAGGGGLFLGVRTTGLNGKGPSGGSLAHESRPPGQSGGPKLPPGAQVTSMVQFDDREVAAGADFPGGGSAVLPGCRPGCNPIVWTSVKGGEWTATWGTLSQGSAAGEQLVVGPHELLLFNADEGTALWYSTDAVTWHQVSLPSAMTAQVVRAVVWGHGHFVAILNNKYAGGPNTSYGESDTVWSSTAGTVWSLDSVSGSSAVFNSLVVVRTGFRIAGDLRQTGASIVWASSDGVTWKAVE